ncbi:MAG: hypothetical protein WBC71_11850, partial [Salaquimonas sp.]
MTARSRQVDRFWIRRRPQRLPDFETGQHGAHVATGFRYIHQTAGVSKSVSKKQKISSKKVLGVDQSSVSKNSIAPAAQAENDQEKAFPIVQRIISENFALYRSSYAVAILCMVIMGGMTALM